MGVLERASRYTEIRKVLVPRCVFEPTMTNVEHGAQVVQTRIATVVEGHETPVV